MQSDLDSLAPSVSTGSPAKSSLMRNTFIFFVITLLVVWFILYAFRPVSVQEKGPNGLPTGRIEPGKAIGYAFLISLVLSLLFAGGYYLIKV